MVIFRSSAFVPSNLYGVLFNDGDCVCDSDCVCDCGWW